MLPAKGPWEHPYYAIEDTFLNVTFTDSAGAARNIGVRHKVTGDGPPLVLVHGLMTSSYSFRHVLEPLGRRYRVFAPDLVGAGLSDKPLDFTYSVANVARFMAAYVRCVSREPVFLVGASLGGLTALRALLLDAAKRPLARRFVLMHAPGYPLVRTRLMSSIFHVPRLGAAAAALVARSAHTFPRAFIANNMHYARKDMLSEEECAEYGRLFETLDGARVFAKILEQSLDPLEHAEIIAELRSRAESGRSIGCPTKVIYARKDIVVPPSFGPSFHADLPGSDFVWMDDTSHALHVDAPERTVDEITSFDTDYADQLEGLISLRSGRLRAAPLSSSETS